MTYREDDQVWGYIKPKLTLNHDWSEFLTPGFAKEIRSVLGSIFSDSQFQMARNKSEFAASKRALQEKGVDGVPDLAELESLYEDWRERTLGFQRLVQRRMNEMDRYIAQQQLLMEKAHTKRERVSLRLLAAAVRAHQRSLQNDADPEPEDLRLWAVLDEIEIPSGSSTLTLTELFESGVWTDG